MDVAVKEGLMTGKKWKSQVHGNESIIEKR
jgi:hypothetical protein